MATAPIKRLLPLPPDKLSVVILMRLILSPQGNAMYAEIPARECARHGPIIEPSNTYVVTRFRVCKAKDYFKSVPGQYMIELTCHTRISRADGAGAYPEHVYNLTPFCSLRDYIGDKKNSMVRLNHISAVFVQRAYSHTPVLPLQIYLEFSSRSPSQNGCRLQINPSQTCGVILFFRMNGMPLLQPFPYPIRCLPALFSILQTSSQRTSHRRFFWFEGMNQ